MFIKKVDKSSKKTGKSYYTYRLCESYRIDNKVRHRTIINVGKLENIRKEDFKLLCDRIEQKVKGVKLLFSNLPDNVEKEADLIYQRILKERLLDCKDNAVSLVEYQEPEKPKEPEEPKEPEGAKEAEELEDSENRDIRKVDINSIIHEDSRTFGGEWLSKQMLDGCGLSGFLSQTISNDLIEKRISAEIISRMIHPSSELETSRWTGSESSLCEMLSLHKTPDHRQLYKAARTLYDLKEKVEDFLYQHFDSKHPDRMHLCLYDLSNFYFEGRKEHSTLAQFGRSKEKRSDAKLISLALLSNGRGFIRRSKLYAGNISEPSTLQEVVSGLEADSKKDAGLFDARPVAVMDAGIATEANLEFLRDRNFDYICVSRGGLQEYSLEENECKTVFDNRKHPIEICIATPDGKTGGTANDKTKGEADGKTDGKTDGDLYLYVKSDMKQQKEQSMSSKLTKRFVAELENIKASLSKKRGVKEEAAVNQRIGRLRQKYPSISKLYTIELKVGENKTVTDIIYEQTKPDREAGVYFIRCSQNRLTEELIWEIYNILRELESTFRCLKTDLDIRPVHHQKDKNTVAHIFLGIVAYQLVHAIRQTLKLEGINHSWRLIRNIMSSQTIVTTRMKLENRDSLILRDMTRPNMEQMKIYRALKFKQTNPKMKKKAVVPHK